MSKLIFYYSVMGSGKTTDVVKTYDIYKRKGLNPLIIKPAIDTRDGHFNGYGTTKSRITSEEIPAYYAKSLKDELWRLDYGILIADEAQFFTPEDIYTLSQVVDRQNIDVLAYGLKNDVNGHLFPGTKALLELADDIKEIDKVCDEPYCLNKATHHLRYINGILDNSSESVAIEKGNITYTSVCRKHWMLAKKEGR